MYTQALTVTFFLPGPLTLVEEPGTLFKYWTENYFNFKNQPVFFLISIADTFFWGSDIFSRAARWLLVNTGTTFNLVLPLLLILFGLALG